MGWLKVLEGKEKFKCLKAASEEQIVSAENELSVRFADDYRAYVSKLGAATFEGHELTGVCISKRLNVVNVTIEERQCLDDVPKGWYVIEQAHIDGIVIWQDENGTIYKTMPGTKAVMIAKDMSEYCACTE